MSNDWELTPLRKAKVSRVSQWIVHCHLNVPWAIPGYWHPFSPWDSCVAKAGCNGSSFFIMTANGFSLLLFALEIKMSRKTIGNTFYFKVWLCGIYFPNFIFYFNISKPSAFKINFIKFLLTYFEFHVKFWIVKY